MKKTAIAICTIAFLTGCTQSLTTEEIIQQVSQPGAQDTRTAILLLKNGLIEDPSSQKLRQLLAQNYMAIGDYQTADKEWMKLFNDNYQLDIVIPNLLQAKFLMAEYDSLSNFVDELASQHIQKISEQQLAGAYVYQALAYYRQDDSDNAAISIELANDITTDEVFTNLGAAISAATQSANQEALKLVKEVVALQPTFTEAQLLQGQLHTLLNELNEAQQVFASIHQQFPDNLRFKLFYAAALIKNDETATAKPVLKELLTDLPLNGYVQQLNAVVAYSEADYEMAKVHAEKAIEGQLYSVSSYTIAALSSVQTGDYEQAKRYLDGIRITFPDDHPITYARLLTNAKLGYTDDSVNELLTKDLSNIDPQLVTATAYQLSRQGRSKQATTLLNKLNTENTNLSEDIRAKANILGIALNKEDTLTTLEEAIAKGSNVSENQRLLLVGYYKNNEFDKAMTLANTVIEQGDAQIGLTIRGLVHLAKNNVEAGKKDFAAILEINPNDINALQFFSGYHITAKNYDEALTYINKALKVSPHNLNSLNHLYNASIGLNSTRDYLQRFADAFALYPSRIEYRLLFANAKFMQKDFDGVIDLLGNYVTNNSTPPMFWSLLANAKIAKNDYMGAQRELEKWRNTHPESVQPYIIELGILELSEDWLTSERLVNRAIRQHPQIAIFKMIKANVLIELKKFDEARNAILILNEEQEQHPKAQTALAHIAFYNEEYEDAIAKYKVLHQSAPSNRIAHKYSQSLFNLNKIDEAIAILDAHTKATPDDLTGIAMLGSFLIRHDTASAVKVYNDLNQKVPNNIFILNNLAYSHYLLEKFDTAESFAKQALDVEPNNEKVLDTLGMIKFKQDDLSSAIAFLEIAYDKAPFDVPIVLNYAEVLIAAGNQKQAEKILESISSNEPDLIARMSDLQKKISG